MSKESKIIPIKSLDEYDQARLLADGSVSLNSDEVSALLKSLPPEEPITRLLHPEVRYEVTDHCNATCIMCPRDKHEHGREHGIMDQAAYERSIDEVVSLGAEKVVLTGFGEPMLDKRLELKIAYAKSKGLSTYIISNGSVLNSKRARSILEAGLDEIRVSFYGMQPKTYNAVMRGLDFDKTIKGMTQFLRLRDELGVKTRIQVSYLEMDENREDSDLFREYWEAKADAIEIWRPHNFGDGRDYRERLDQIEVKTTCGRPENGPLQIQWNGEVIPCCYDYNNQIILGNAFSESVLDILNAPKYRLLRWAHRNKQFGAFPYCDQCDQLLPRADALVYTNRHNLPPEEAVKLSNTDLYNLADGLQLDEKQMNSRYVKGRA